MIIECVTEEPAGESPAPAMLTQPEPAIESASPDEVVAPFPEGTSSEEGVESVEASTPVSTDGETAKIEPDSAADPIIRSPGDSAMLDLPSDSEGQTGRSS